MLGIPKLNDGSNRKSWELVSRYPSGSYYVPSLCPRSVKRSGFGWGAVPPTVPPTVTQAATVMAGRLLRRAREAPFDVVGLGFESGAMWSLKMDAGIELLLTHYVRGVGLAAGA